MSNYTLPNKTLRDPSVFLKTTLHGFLTDTGSVSCGQYLDRTLGKFPPLYGPHLTTIPIFTISSLFPVVLIITIASEDVIFSLIAKDPVIAEIVSNPHRDDIKSSGKFAIFN